VAIEGVHRGTLVHAPKNQKAASIKLTLAAVVLDAE
jgi:hypothetical protein